MQSIVIADTNTSTVYDLTTVEDVNAELGIDADTAADAITASEITNYSKLIAEICDRTFANVSVVETFMAPTNYMRALSLRNYPVSEIIYVKVNGATVPSTDYKIDPDSGLLWRWNAGFGLCGWSGCGTIEVSYIGGYDLPGGAPASLARAVIELIEDARVSGTRDTSIRDIQHGDRRVSFFNASVSGTNAALPASVADLIRPFKRIVV